MVDVSGRDGTVDEHDVDELLQEQTRYYRARADTYDLDMQWDTEGPQLRESLAPVYGWFAELPVGGQVLELACGTGAWTARLATRADQVHAIDVAPEMVERAEARVGAENGVTFEVADLYRWQPPTAFDVIFFSFLLTHVPPTRVSRFWRLVSSSLAEGGLVAFVDAAPHRHDEEEWLGDGIVRRVLRDGSEHRVVKVFPTPERIVGSMADHGLEAKVDVLSDAFLVGVGRRSTSDSDRPESWPLRRRRDRR